MEVRGLCVTISNNNKSIKDNINVIRNVFSWPGNCKYGKGNFWNNIISGEAGSLQVSGTAAGERREHKMTEIAEKVQDVEKSDRAN